MKQINASIALNKETALKWVIAVVLILLIGGSALAFLVKAFGDGFLTNSADQGRASGAVERTVTQDQFNALLQKIEDLEQAQAAQTQADADTQAREGNLLQEQPDETDAELEEALARIEELEQASADQLAAIGDLQIQLDQTVQERDQLRLQNEQLTQEKEQTAAALEAYRLADETEYILEISVTRAGAFGQEEEVQVKRLVTEEEYTRYDVGDMIASQADIQYPSGNHWTAVVADKYTKIAE